MHYYHRREYIFGDVPPDSRAVSLSNEKPHGHGRRADAQFDLERSPNRHLHALSAKGTSF